MIREGRCHIRTRPSWLLGASALLFFVGVMVLVTKWLDADRSRPNAAVPPACIGLECGEPDAHAGTPRPAPGQTFVRSNGRGADAGPSPGAATRSNGADQADEEASDGGHAGPAGAYGGGPRVDEGGAVLIPAPVGSVVIVAPGIDNVIVVGASPDASVAVSPPSASRDAGAPRPQPEAAPPQREPVRCGTVTCPEGQVCCNSSCGICAAPGAGCRKELCGVSLSPVSTPCGPNTCDVGEVCCNATCGICTAVGQSCSKEPCNIIQNPTSTPCGLNTCNVGEVCCNASCGICTPPGESCSWEPCLH